MLCYYVLPIIQFFESMSNIHDYEISSTMCFIVSPIVRLVDGTNYNGSQGRVEIQYNGQWGTVCDDEWDIDDAKVVCRSLGFPAAEEAVTDLTFGEGSDPIVLDDVDCDGDESDIFDCDNRGLGNHNCAHYEDAGVRCATDLQGISYKILPERRKRRVVNQIFKKKFTINYYVLYLGRIS